MISVHAISADDWKQLSEAAHIAVFDRVKPKEIERIDYALVVENEKEELLAYVTCKELDSQSLYWQYGGIFKNHRKTGKSIEVLNHIADWCVKKYQYIGCRVENGNIPMLKLAMNSGFRVVGIRIFKGKIYLEHLLEGENGDKENLCKHD